MNFDEAITIHADWKRKLSTYLRKPDGTLHPSEVALDNKCELGKWIAGEGRKFSQLTQFNSLKLEHTRFHKAAADVVRRADAGANTSAEVVLGADSEFSRASGAVVQAIMGMKAASHN